MLYKHPVEKIRFETFLRFLESSRVFLSREMFIVLIYNFLQFVFIEYDWSTCSKSICSWPRKSFGGTIFHCKPSVESSSPNCSYFFCWEKNVFWFHFSCVLIRWWDGHLIKICFHTIDFLLELFYYFASHRLCSWVEEKLTISNVQITVSNSYLWLCRMHYPH